MSIMWHKNIQKEFLNEQTIFRKFRQINVRKKWPRNNKILSNGTCLASLKNSWNNSSLLPNISWLYNQGWLQVLFLSSTMGTKKFFLPHTKIEDNHYFSWPKSLLWHATFLEVFFFLVKSNHFGFLLWKWFDNILP